MRYLVLTLKMKPSTSSWRNRSLALGACSWGFQVQGRGNYRKAPENAGEGRFEGVVPRVGQASKSPRTSGLLASTGQSLNFQETRFQQIKSTRRRGRQFSPGVYRFKLISLRQRLVLA